MTTKPSAKAKPNIRMVAERVQLSPATVSLALRGSESIAAETRARVLEAARELNYVPAPRPARAVAERAQPPLQLAHLLFLTKDFGDRPVTANPFYGEILSAAEAECAEKGVRLSFTLLPNSERTTEQLASTFATYEPDGILLVGAYAPSVVRQVSASTNAPIVLVDNVVPGVRCDSVMADDFGGAQLSTQHLIQRGHRHIAAIVGDPSSPSFMARYRGYSAACTAAGLTPAPAEEMIWSRQSLHAALEHMLAQTPRPTALFCVTDAYAVFMMELLRDMGLQVPHDVSVVGFDDFPIARMAHPPITTLHNHPEVLGRIGVQRLLARIGGDTTPSLNITVATQLVIRESTRYLV